MNLSRQSTIGLAVAAVAVAIFVVAGIYAFKAKPEPVEKGPAQAALLVRADSHRLSEAKNAKVTLVEFLDFECEACGAAYPYVEQLREKYDGRVEFVARYFPLPGHGNSRNAAHAVEAAARQGKFEQMYRRMFETQQAWGESQDSKAPLFRTYAKDLGLDMKRYDRDVASKAVAARVQRDFEDGQTLGVTGTPGFFLNGERLVPMSGEDLARAIDEALAK